MKRTFDLLFAATGLVALTPVLGLLALAVWVSSPGPVFFRQERLGLAGESFRICKFRTMTVRNTGPAVTAGNDARITPVGRFLRRHKLDELPQLWNVLKGDMSFVGPRPEVPEFAELFPERYARILRVRPGITHGGTLLFRREEEILASVADPRRFYIDEVLPAKMTAYEADLAPGLLQDIRVIVATIAPFLAAEPFGPEDFIPAVAMASAPADADEALIPAAIAALEPILRPTPLAPTHLVRPAARVWTQPSHQSTPRVAHLGSALARTGTEAARPSRRQVAAV